MACLGLDAKGRTLSGWHGTSAKFCSDSRQPEVVQLVPFSEPSTWVTWVWGLENGS